MSSTHVLFSDKGRCSIQSKRALYGNFIVMYATQHLCLIFCRECQFTLCSLRLQNCEQRILYNQLGKVSKEFSPCQNQKSGKLLEYSCHFAHFNCFSFALWDCFTESVRWPAGSYGLPKPASGCPRSDGFVWWEGWRSQSTHGRASNSTKSTKFHLDGIVDDTKVKRSFCIKEDIADDGSRSSWPQGQFCKIFRSFYFQVQFTVSQYYSFL